MNTNSEIEKAYVWPLVNLQRESGWTFGAMMDFIDQMVQSMYAVNCTAYEHEYEEACEIKEVVFEAAPVLTPIELFKALEAWRYNSVYSLEQDDIILSISGKDGEAMYLAVDVLHSIAEKIVRGLLEYDKAKWAL